MTGTVMLALLLINIGMNIFADIATSAQILRCNTCPRSSSRRGGAGDEWSSSFREPVRRSTPQHGPAFSKRRQLHSARRLLETTTTALAPAATPTPTPAAVNQILVGNLTCGTAADRARYQNSSRLELDYEQGDCAEGCGAKVWSNVLSIMHKSGQALGGFLHASNLCLYPPSKMLAGNTCLYVCVCACVCVYENTLHSVLLCIFVERVSGLYTTHTY